MACNNPSILSAPWRTKRSCDHPAERVQRNGTAKAIDPTPRRTQSWLATVVPSPGRQVRPRSAAAAQRERDESASLHKRTRVYNALATVCVSPVVVQHESGMLSVKPAGAQYSDTQQRIVGAGGRTVGLKDKSRVAAVPEPKGSMQPKKHQSITLPIHSKAPGPCLVAKPKASLPQPPGAPPPPHLRAGWDGNLIPEAGADPCAASDGPQKKKFRSQVGRTSSHECHTEPPPSAVGSAHGLVGLNILKTAQGVVRGVNGGPTLDNELQQLIEIFDNHARTHNECMIEWLRDYDTGTGWWKLLESTSVVDQRYAKFLTDSTRTRVLGGLKNHEGEFRVWPAEDADRWAECPSMVQRLLLSTANNPRSRVQMTSAQRYLEWHGSQGCEHFKDCFSEPPHILTEGHCEPNINDAVSTLAVFQTPGTLLCLRANTVVSLAEVLSTYGNCKCYEDLYSMWKNGRRVILPRIDELAGDRGLMT